MTTARHRLVDRNQSGFYHCISRCVRRAWLCGVDALSGRSFEHRRKWVEQRLLELADIFAVGLYAYAVMSNHTHVVLRVDPRTARAWSDEEVAVRWVRLFPARIDGMVDTERCREKEGALLRNADRLATCRERLGDLSWFMRALNEPIARRANEEDACTGRFWEGRYTCQALLDEAAVLACMNYVDLNPVRAGIAEDLPRSHHTGVKRRIENLGEHDAAAPLPALAGIEPGFAVLAISTASYLDLVDWTARLTRPDKRGHITADTPPILQKLGLRDTAWERHVLGIETRYSRAVGSAQSLIDKAAVMGQRWLKGVSAARRLVRTEA
ncbi:transposase [Dokdonella sp. MW10]|uniref:transposase n=1 Tax=Dokdonella sp. MW10 TaxID=2992926 RepID=UPI003F7E10C3